MTVTGIRHSCKLPRNDGYRDKALLHAPSKKNGVSGLQLPYNIGCFLNGQHLVV
jgi:hypothetical protein